MGSVATNERRVEAIVQAVFARGGNRLAYMLRNALTNLLINRVSKWHPKGENRVRRRLSDNRTVVTLYRRILNTGGADYSVEFKEYPDLRERFPTWELAADAADEALRSHGFIIRAEDDG